MRVITRVLRVSCRRSPSQSTQRAPEQAHYPQHEVVAHGLQAPARMNPAVATAGCSHVIIIGIRFLQRLKQRSLVDVLVRLGPWHRLPRVALAGPALGILVQDSRTKSDQMTSSPAPLQEARLD